MTADVDALLVLIEQEEARRDQLVADIRDAVAAVYITGGDTDFLVRRSQVHQLIADARGLRTMDGNLKALINAVVAGMGAVATSIGNRPVFLAMRRRDMEAKDARRQSRVWRKIWHAKKPTHRQRARKLSADEIADWQRRLDEEGLGEVAFIQRQRLSASAYKHKEGAEGPATDGVHRQKRATQAEIYSAANDRVTEMLAVAELEVQVLRLRAQGLALRPIGIRLGIDKMEVDAILKRVAARQTSSQGCE